VIVQTLTPNSELRVLDNPMNTISAYWHARMGEIVRFAQYEPDGLYTVMVALPDGRPDLVIGVDPERFEVVRIARPWWHKLLFWRKS
jgi:hypothetical protein